MPVLYYGTEQGFTAQRGAMFAAGFASGGRDRFDTDHPLYRSIARLTALRASDKLFSRGLPTVLHGEGALAGLHFVGYDIRQPGGLLRTIAMQAERVAAHIAASGATRVTPRAA